MAALRTALATGASLRDAAKAAGVSHETARTWMRATKPPTKRTSASTTKPDLAAAERLVSSPLPSRDDPEALSAVRARVALVAGLLERLTPAMESGDCPPGTWVSIARYGDELARLLAELTPPPPIDPTTDAAVIEAERELFQRIASMVSEAER
jgi:hypothetical protein